MQEDVFTRSRALIGEEKLNRLRRSHVFVLGLGGVGGICAEMLLRSGVGTLTIMDGDTVSQSNINRQILATAEAVGRPKAEVMRERLLSILPEADIRAHQVFMTPELLSHYIAGNDVNYVVDAIDTITVKIALAVHCKKHGVPLVSAMGAGNKLDMGALRASDLYETSIDPVCRVMRRELRKRGVESLRVVYSTEPPRGHQQTELDARTPASMPFVPNAMGLLLAQTVVNELVGA